MCDLQKKEAQEKNVGNTMLNYIWNVQCNRTKNNKYVITIYIVNSVSIKMFYKWHFYSQHLSQAPFGTFISINKQVTIKTFQIKNLAVNGLNCLIVT